MSRFDHVATMLAEDGYPLRRRFEVQPGVMMYDGRCPNSGHSDTRSRRLRIFDHGDRVGLHCHGSKADLGHLSDVGLAPGDFGDPDRLQELERDMAAWALQVPNEPAWPVLDDRALIGLPGDFVRTVEPHTEADPVGLLVQFLVLFGVMVGPKPHLVLDGSRHALNEFVALVGETSKGRKGTAWAHVEAAFLASFSRFDDLVISGLSSGEGLIWEVRDAIIRPGKDGQPETVDHGVQDKRRLAMEHELSRVLRAQNREGNTLSAIERDAWDGRVLRSLVKNASGSRTGSYRATGAHVSIIGHITEAELKRSLTETDVANGYANRFLWLCVRRSKVLPRGGGEVDWGSIPTRIRAVRMFIDDVDLVKVDEPAWVVWDAVYEPLSEGKPGLFGAMVARGEAHVMRLAALYALADSSTTIRTEHLFAALALWDYVEASARRIFGRALGDANADAVLHAIKLERDAGKTRTELHAYFSGHMLAKELSRALNVLATSGLIRVVKESDSKGRPAERYHAWAEDAAEPEPYLELALSSLSSPPKGFQEEDLLPIYAKEAK